MCIIQKTLISSEEKKIINPFTQRLTHTGHYYYICRIKIN